MKIIPTPLAGAYVIDLVPHHDDRGYFVRTFCTETFRKHGLCTNYFQANQSFTKGLGVVRGMHFQHPPAAEVKLVRCTRGKVWDCFVDLRHGSPTFLQYFGLELSEDNFQAAYIPAGFAHGFQTLVPNCDLAYQVSAQYTPGAEGAVHYDEPRVGIRWPLPVEYVSPKDAQTPLLKADYSGVVV